MPTILLDLLFFFHWLYHFHGGYPFGRRIAASAAGMGWDIGYWLMNCWMFMNGVLQLSEVLALWMKGNAMLRMC